jgi:colanic acid/amylovoran biosynthesis protein
MKILITNTVLQNGGDAAIALALIRQLKAAFGETVSITLCDAAPDVSKKYYSELVLRESLASAFLPPARPGRGRLIWGAWRFFRWGIGRPLGLLAARYWHAGGERLAGWLLSTPQREFLQMYAKADLIVSTGGTYLVEHYALAPRVFEFDVARLLGRPLALFTQSMGPFHRPAHRRALRRALGYAGLILLRDGRSLGHVRDLGVSTDRCMVLPDAVFSMRTLRPAHPPDRPFAVAVSVRQWAHFGAGSPEEGMARYRRAMAAMVSHLVSKHDARVVFISTCQGIPEYGYDDARVAQEIVSLLPEAVRRRVEVDASFHRPEELIERMAGFDLAVATRMHMAILALVAGTPVVPVAYEFKTRELFQRLGYVDGEGSAGGALDIATIDETNACAAVEAILPRLDGVRRSLATQVESLSIEADAAVDAFRRWAGRPEGTSR